MSPQKKCNRAAAPPPRRHQPLIRKEKIDSVSLDASVQLKKHVGPNGCKKKKKKRKKKRNYRKRSAVAIRLPWQQQSFRLWPVGPSWRWHRATFTSNQVSHKNTPLVWFSGGKKTKKKKPAGFYSEINTSNGLKELQPPPASIRSKDKTPRTPRKQINCRDCKFSISELSHPVLKRHVATGKFLH